MFFAIFSKSSSNHSLHLTLNSYTVPFLLIDYFRFLLTGGRAYFLTAYATVILAIQSEKTGPDKIYHRQIRNFRKGVRKDVASRSIIETKAKNSDCVRNCSIIRRQASGFF